jgi:predicted nucleotidyltransferase
MNEARLNELFGGKERFSLIKMLYLNPARIFRSQDLAKASGVNSGNASRLLSRWAELGLVIKRIDGRNVTYQASGDPLLSGLTDIVHRNDALLDDIRTALPAGADIALVFGSAARAEERADSDIDILVLGKNLSPIRVNAALRPIGRKHSRIINASVFSQEEYEILLRENDDFAVSLTTQKTIPIKGVFEYAASKNRPFGE